MPMASAPRRPLVAGNWKMNGLSAAAAELARIIAGARALTAIDLMVCPPATLLAQRAAAAPGPRAGRAARPAPPDPAGASPGDRSAEMLKDPGASAVILGHSERRAG